MKPYFDPPSIVILIWIGTMILFVIGLTIAGCSSAVTEMMRTYSEYSGMVVYNV